MDSVIWERLPSSYDAVASEYEATFLDELDSKPEDQAMLRNSVEITTGLIADLGCGPGQVGRFVRSQGRTAFGVDISAEMARLASARLDGALVSDIRQLAAWTRSGTMTSILSQQPAMRYPDRWL